MDNGRGNVYTIFLNKEMVETNELLNEQNRKSNKKYVK